MVLTASVATAMAKMAGTRMTSMAIADHPLALDTLSSRDQVGQVVSEAVEPVFQSVALVVVTSAIRATTREKVDSKITGRLETIA